MDKRWGKSEMILAWAFIQTLDERVAKAAYDELLKRNPALARPLEEYNRAIIVPPAPCGDSPQ